jgi:hypothetical protein
MMPIRLPPENKGEPLRWHKSQGEPRCVIEVVMQNSWLLIPYIAIVCTAVLVLLAKGM